MDFSLSDKQGDLTDAAAAFARQSVAALIQSGYKPGLRRLGVPTLVVGLKPQRCYISVHLCAARSSLVMC
jgi:hypothetical protein